RMKGNDAAVPPLARPKQLPHLAGADIHHLDSRAVEMLPRRIAARIVRAPLAVRRPSADVGQDMATAAARDLPFAPEPWGGEYFLLLPIRWGAGRGEGRSLSTSLRRRRVLRRCGLAPSLRALLDHRKTHQQAGQIADPVL